MATETVPGATQTENDIIVTYTFQDTSRPLTYLQTEDLPAFRRGSVIVDVSCDLGMGFSWARPTTFDETTCGPTSDIVFAGKKGSCLALF